MSNLIEIKYDTLLRLTKLSEELRKKAIKSALIFSLMQSRNSVIKLARKEMKKSGDINLDVDKFKKRIRSGRDQVDMTYPIPQLSASIIFSIFDEALSSFPNKKTRVIGKDGRKYLGISPTVLGKQLNPDRTFLRMAKKGRAVNGSLLSLARTSKDRNSYKKQKLNVSISDILLKNNPLHQSLTNKALIIYNNRLAVNLNYYITKEISRFKSGK